MTGTIELLHGEGVAEIVLRNPERRNAITIDMWRRLKSIAMEPAELEGMRCVVIYGEGAVFSAGADISEFETGRSERSAATYDDLVEETVRAFEALPVPTVAAISGHCIGAGASISCGCDLRVADRDAFFAVPAARLGLGYDPRGIARFLRVLGDPMTRRLLLTGGRLPAELAYATGAISLLSDPGKARSEAMALARRIAQNAPLTLAAAKASLNELTCASEPSESIRALARKADDSSDYAEGVAAFREGRTPRFEGK